MKFYVHFLRHDLDPWEPNKEWLRLGKPDVVGPFDLDEALAKRQELDDTEITSEAYISEDP